MNIHSPAQQLRTRSFSAAMSTQTMKSHPRNRGLDRRFFARRDRRRRRAARRSPGKRTSQRIPFVFAEQDGRALGYTCYGPIALTAASYDLYWIAVDKNCQGQKIGQLLLAKSEELISSSGGRQIYIETSNRPQYAPTRKFYLRCGYRQEALLKDFYAPGDDKVIYVKHWLVVDSAKRLAITRLIQHSSFRIHRSSLFLASP